MERKNKEMNKGINRNLRIKKKKKGINRNLHKLNKTLKQKCTVLLERHDQFQNPSS
jgi:hypothetical protein